MRRKTWIVVCLLLFIGSSVYVAKIYRDKERREERERRSAPILEPMAIGLEKEHEEEEEREGKEEEGNVEERNDWFFYQRAYPFGSIPDNARRNAWDSIGKGKVQTASVGASLTGWSSIGPAPTRPAFLGNWGVTSGRINAIAVSPVNTNLILIGSATGGIFRSIDGGNSFAPVTDNQVDLAVGSLAFSKSNPQIVYAGMGDPKGGYYGSGVLKSTDAGQTWTRVNDASLPSPGNVAKIEVDPTNPNRIYLAQYSRLVDTRRLASGFFYSTDGGISWTKTLSGLPRDVVLDVANPKTLYVGMARVDAPTGTPAGVYRSTDEGATFDRVFTSPYNQNQTSDMRLAVTPANPQTIYAYTGGTEGSTVGVRVIVSTDSGQTWTNRGSNGIDPNQFGYNTYIYADPSNASTVYVGSRDVFKSTDSGVTWANKTGNFHESGNNWSYEPRSSNSHPDQHSLAFVGNNGNNILIGNDGGLSVSSNGGDNFTSLNATLNLSMFVSMAVHPANPAISYGGTQDNGTQRRLTNTNQWQEFATGDGGKVVITPNAPSTVFTTYVRGVIFRFFNDTANYDQQVASNSTFQEPENGSRIAFYAPFTSNGLDSTLYFGSYRLFISTDSGTSWNAPAGELDLTKGVTANGTDLLTAIGVGPANTSLIYTGSRQGRVMTSADAGRNWTDATVGLPDRSITNITVNPVNSSIAYITFSGFNTGHIFRTTNSGLSWNDISANLPDIPVNALLIDPRANTTLYAGTDIGVFLSTNSGVTWQPFNEGLPPVIVTSFSAQQNGLIQIGTYGRGVFEFNPNGNSPFINNVDYNGAKAMVITGSNFGSNPRVFINDVDKTELIRTASAAKIKMKGKASLFGFTAGENVIKVVGDGGASSSNYILRL
jgi:photosystem II stability/assembly factor-like uncharacterized protein